jgi:opacity protein-like surface antigen
MKKLIATAAAAAALMLTASPAVAQVTVAGDGNTSAQYVDASQVQVAIGVQYGDQNAAASDGSTAEASNGLSITQNQANAGLGEIDDLNQGTDYVGDVLIFY